MLTRSRSKKMSRDGVVTRSMAKRMEELDGITSGQEVSNRKRVKRESETGSEDFPSPFDKLPNEVLEMILSNLQNDHPSALNCRLVNPRWKSVMDLVLENECLSTWKIWNPFDNNLDNHQYFPLVRQSWFSFAQPVPMIFCPKGLEKKRRNPFPAKSMQLSRGVSSRLNTRYHYITLSPIRLVDTFYKKLGHHLTSLVFDNVNMHQATLLGILNFTPNLKALTLSNVDIEGLLSWSEENSCQLPPLTCLIYLKLGAIHFTCNDRSFNVYTWLVNPYLNQLEGLSLDFSGCLIRKPSRLSLDNDAVYPNLKQLKIISPSPSFLNNTKGFSNLRRLSIIHNFDADFGAEESDELQRKRFTLHDLTAFIDNFARTLEQLHLDVIWKLLRQAGTMGNQLRVENIRGTPQVILPRVKRCAVRYPRDSSDASLVQQCILPKIPAINTLKMLYYRPAHFRIYIFGYPVFATVEVETQRLFGRERFWDSCRYLKRIEVHADGGNSEAVFVSNRPARDNVQ